VSFNRPAIKDIISRVKSDITSRLTGKSAVLIRSVVAVLSRAIAGVAHLLHGHLEWISKQIIPDTAEKEYLTRWARLFSVYRKAATFAQGPYVFTGTPGVTVPAGSELIRADGVKYTTDADGIVGGGGTISVAITCEAAGEAGNVDEANPMTLVSPVSGIQSDGVVDAGGINDGEDEESDESLLDRLLIRLQNPPQGGSEADYKAWLLEIPGVTRAWVYPLNEGPGTVGGSFVLDGEVDIFPDAGKVAEAQAYIDERRNVTGDATIFAPIDYPVAFNITLNPNTAATRAAVEAELADLFKRDAEPGVLIPLSHLNEAISIAAGEYDHVLNAPVADVNPGAGNLPTLGAVVFV